MTDGFNRYKLGDPTDKATTVGPVISSKAVENIQRHINDALSQGAIDATTESPTLSTVPSNGSFVAPRILTNVTHNMLVMREETFGPVIPIMKVSSDEEAVALMNDSEYGLTASVWTKDIQRGEELIEEIEAGTVYINRCDYPSPVRTCLSSLLCDWNKLANNASGPCMDWMEELGAGMLARTTCFQCVL